MGRLLFWLLLMVVGLDAKKVNVDIAGTVFCISNSSMASPVEVRLYNVGWLGYESFVGRSLAESDGHFKINKTVDTWHEFSGRLEIEHVCGLVQDKKVGDQSITMVIPLNDGAFAVELPPIILDLERPSDVVLTQFMKQHPAIDVKSEIIRGYESKEAPWYAPWKIKMDLGLL
ncbi:hypothetical protein M3Y95_01087000 [Aphelenchoides besseyi]|nr:hypothetical protein M3Y95_01087000 [Aphelenchoides besseyi]